MPRPSLDSHRNQTTAQRKRSSSGANSAVATIPSYEDSPSRDLADRARIELEGLIVTLKLAPGSLWSELQLSERVKIGRTPVREALQRLEADGLVKIMPRFGIQITEVSVAQQLLLLEVRRVLERLIAQSAAKRASAEERDTMLRMAAELERLADSDVLTFLRYHYEVKVFLAGCARNTYAAVAIAPMQAVSRRFYYLHYRTNHDMPLAAARHSDVLRAVALGDQVLASEAADRLMDYVENITRATVLQPTLSLLQCDVDTHDSRP